MECLRHVGYGVTAILLSVLLTGLVVALAVAREMVKDHRAAVAR